MTQPERLDDLESRLTHLERALQDMSDVLIRQQKELDRAQERNKILADRLAALQDDGAGPVTLEEPPPHY